jgi:hypothetical protein
VDQKPMLTPVEERSSFWKIWRVVAGLRLKLGELMMEVDQSRLTVEEQAEFSSLLGNPPTQFAAAAEAIRATSNEELYKQATASLERLMEQTEGAIASLEQLIAKQAKSA